MSSRSTVTVGYVMAFYVGRWINSRFRQIGILLAMLVTLGIWVHRIYQSTDGWGFFWVMIFPVGLLFGWGGVEAWAIGICFWIIYPVFMLMALLHSGKSRFWVDLAILLGVYCVNLAGFIYMMKHLH